MRRRGRWFGPKVRGVDSHDATSFPSGALRARVLAIALAATAVALVATGAWSARHLQTGQRGLLRPGTTGVVVVDLSLSIDGEDYAVLRRAFRRLIAENASIGLVVFSDVAYELLPPGTPASQLRPLLRLLVPPRFGPPVNPWTQTFRAGTQISSALQLAENMLRRDHVPSGSVLLVSDLETAPDDVPALARTIESLRSNDIALHVIALGPTRDARLLFGSAIQDTPFVVPGAAGRETQDVSETTISLPTTLLVLGALFFVVVAAHERFAGRLMLAGGSGRQA
jgi:VWA domain-containing protein